VTGIRDNSEEVLTRTQLLKGIVSSHNLTVGCCVEFGPGQTIEILSKLKKELCFKRVIAVDIENYFSMGEWAERDLEYVDYSELSSLSNSSVDLVYGFDVLEHVRNPDLFLGEVSRILTDDGVAYFSWDLRDHLHLDTEELWFDMHKYNSSLWWWRMSNRASFVNRLMKNDWLELFESHKLNPLSVTLQESELASRKFKEQHDVSLDPTFRMTAIMRKSGAHAG
jgi:SAM-dependent methyltransferase